MKWSDQQWHEPKPRSHDGREALVSKYFDRVDNPDGTISYQPKRPSVRELCAEVGPPPMELDLTGYVDVAPEQLALVESVRVGGARFERVPSEPR